MLLTITGFFVFLVSSGNYVTSYAAFDWYDSSQQLYYKIINFSYIHILEIIILSICAYTHRYALFRFGSNH